MRALTFALLVVASCSTGEDEPVKPDISDASACGDEVTGVSVTFRGVTGTRDRKPAAGANVRVEDRWAQPPALLGEATSAADGTYTVEATNISYLDDCWGSTDFVISAETDELYGELPVSRELHGAILDGTMIVDLTREPIYLDAP